MIVIKYYYYCEENKAFDATAYGKGMNIYHGKQNAMIPSIGDHIKRQLKYIIYGLVNQNFDNKSKLIR